MKRYKNIFNILALLFLSVFFIWMFSFATPGKGYTENWKPKHSMKYQTKSPELKQIMEIKQTTSYMLVSY